MKTILIPKVSVYYFTLILVFFVNSQINNCSAQNLFPCRDNGAGLWGYCNEKFILAIPFMYEKAFEFNNGLAKVSNSFKWGYIDMNGEEVIPIEFERVIESDSGVIWAARPYLKYRCYNIKGEMVFPDSFNYVKKFSEGLAAVKKDKLWGYIDKNGKLVIPYKYEETMPFSHNLAAVKNKNWGFINNKGEQTIEFKYPEVSEPMNGYTKVKVKKSMYEYWGLLDENGKEIIPTEYDSVFFPNDDLIRVRNATKYGFYDIDGTLAIDLKYESAKDFSGGFSIVGINKKYGLIDKKGREVQALKFDKISDFKNGFAITETNMRHGLLNNKGEEIISPLYYLVLIYSNGIIAAQDKDGWRFLDDQVKEMSNKRYQIVGSDFFNDRLLVVKNKEFGFIDKEIKEVISTKYRAADQFVLKVIRVMLDDGVFQVVDLNGRELLNEAVDEIKGFVFERAIFKKDRKFGIINNLGVELTTRKYDEIEDFKNGIAKVRLNWNYGLIDYDGREITPLKYSNITGFAGVTSLPNHLSYVSINQEQVTYNGVIDTKGNEIIPPIYHEIRDGDGGIFKVRQNDLWGFVNIEGVQLTPVKYERVESFRDGEGRFIFNGRRGYIDKTGKEYFE
jgi:hypothetical protein